MRYKHHRKHKHNRKNKKMNPETKNALKSIANTAGCILRTSTLIVTGTVKFLADAIEKAVKSTEK